MKIKTVIVGLLQTNCYIIEDEVSAKCAVIDPGGNFDRISEALEGRMPEYIILTHGHFDHLLAAARLQRETGAKVLVHKLDEGMMQEKYVKNSGYFRGNFDAPKADGYLTDGMTIELGQLKLTVLNTPGHSKGSCVIICGDCIFSGDTLFYESWGRCDLDGGDDNEMLQSLRRIGKLDGEYTVYPGHGESTLLSHERQYNYLMRAAIL
ncbi:MAG: MBL fold metallo-hydrolase [Clostridia bacterium]|nr:MBL fold metallo-hydrolase [Clostridia bacterium]